MFLIKTGIVTGTVFIECQVLKIIIWTIPLSDKLLFCLSHQLFIAFIFFANRLFNSFGCFLLLVIVYCFFNSTTAVSAAAGDK